MLHIERFTVNFIEENCYVVSGETQDCVIIDCGAYFPEEQAAIVQYVADNHLTPRHLLCTHGHFDHIFGAQCIADAYGIGPTLCADEVETYSNAAEQMRKFLHRDFPLTLPPIAATVHAGDSISFGSHTLKVIASPGHTPGGVCYYCEAEGVLFSGDSLFRHAIGRCDLPGGDGRALVEALQKNVLTLPEATRVLPGHGDETTVGEERRANPYI